MTANARRRVFRTLLAVLPIALLLLGVEIAVRIHEAHASRRYRFDRSAVFFRPDPSRLHPFVHPAEPYLSVAVVGDSFSMGHGVQRCDSYGARLEWLLNLTTSAPPAAVHLLARAGRSTYSEEALLDDALALNPRLVILGVCLNDTEDFRNPGQIQTWRNELTLPRQPGPLLARALRTSRALGWAYRRSEAARTRRGLIRYYRHLYDERYPGWRLFTETVPRFRDKCRAVNAELVAVIWPLFSFNLREGHYPFEDQHAALHRVFEGAGVPCLDLLPCFRQADHTRMQVVPFVDPHPNEIAHRIGAEAIFIFLLRNGFIDPAYQPDPSAQPRLRQIWRQTRQLLLDPARG